MKSPTLGWQVTTLGKGFPLFVAHYEYFRLFWCTLSERRQLKGVVFCFVLTSSFVKTQSCSFFLESALLYKILTSRCHSFRVNKILFSSTTNVLLITPI